MCSAVLPTAGCAGLEAPQMFCKLLMSAFFSIFGWFSVALKWLTERSGKQWSWHMNFVVGLHRLSATVSLLCLVESYIKELQFQEPFCSVK